jgi:sugar phosphate isomerase/epimerase
MLDRRSFLGTTVCLTAMLPSASLFASTEKRRFTLDLCPGRIGVQSDQQTTLAFGKQFGFESIEPFGETLATLSSAELVQLLDTLKESGLVWGAGGLSVDFRGSEETFKGGMQKLPAIASAFEKAGVTRVGTWLRPNHKELTYTQNFKLHVVRLREIAKVYADHSIRFGLEYVGPKTLWSKERYPFIHSLVETRDLIEAIGLSNVGIVLDSWHWYTAKETLDDLRTLRNSDIVAVDLNDAPAGIEIDQQIDNQRLLPCDSGVIDVSTFLNFLHAVEYDGPVRAEPFNDELNRLDDAPAVERTAIAMKKAIAISGLV